MHEDLFITHYFPSNVSALNSITACPQEKRNEIVALLSKSQGIGFNRYRKFRFYLCLRLRAEKWLYDEFKNMGGIPATRTPVYFVLGNSRYMQKWFGENTRSLSIPLGIIPETDISFTLKDSIYAMISHEKKLLTKAELFIWINGNSLEEINDKYDIEGRYIEAQLWNPSALPQIFDDRCGVITI